MKKYLFALVLAFPLLSFGQAATYPANFDRFMTLATGASSQTIGFASNGSPVPTTAYAGTGAHVGNLGVFPDAVSGSKGLEVRGGASLPIGNKGVMVPITAVGKVSAASLGKAFSALAGLAGGPVGLAAAVGIPFVMQWMATSGVTLDTVAGTYRQPNQTCGWSSNNTTNSSTNCDPQEACKGEQGYTASMLPAIKLSGTSGAVGEKFTCNWIREITRNSINNSGTKVASESEVIARLATVQPNPYVLSELYNKAVIDNKIDLNIVAAGPSGVAGPVSTVNTPATELTPASTTTTSTDYNCTYVMAVTSCNESTTVIKDGVVTQTQTQPAEPAITCGLPNTPVCAVRVDETGTMADPKLDARKTTDDTMKPITDFAKNPVGSLPTLPTMNWAFTLPTGCTALTIPAFAPYLQDIDICQFQPMFHDIMGVVWVIGALFGAMGMFFRNVFATV